MIVFPFLAIAAALASCAKAICASAQVAYPAGGGAPLAGPFGLPGLPGPSISGGLPGISVIATGTSKIFCPCNPLIKSIPSSLGAYGGGVNPTSSLNTRTAPVL